MKSFRRILAIVMAIALMVSCFAISANAAPSTLISLSSNGYSECDKGNLSDYNITWDATNEIWVLDGTKISYLDMLSYNKAIVTEGNIKLLIKGNCSISLDSSTGDSEQISDIGIFSNDNLTIDFAKDASLTIDGGYYSIQSIGDIIINGNNSNKLSFPSSCFLAIRSESNCTIDSIDLEIDKYGEEGSGVSVSNFIKVTNSKFSLGIDEELADSGLTAYGDIEINNCSGKIKAYDSIYSSSDGTVSIIDSSLDLYAPVGSSSGGVKFIGNDKITITSVNTAVSSESCMEFNLSEGAYVKATTTSSNKTILSWDAVIDITLAKGAYVEAVCTGDNEDVDDCAIYSYGNGLNITLAEDAYVYLKAKDLAVSSSGNINLTTAKVTNPDGGYIDGAKVVDENGNEVAECKIEFEPIVYEIEENADVNGSNVTWTKGGTEGLTITSTAELGTFAEKVTVDGEEVSRSNYSVTKGSIKITFIPTFLETLSLGTHTVVIYSTDGAATGIITIKDMVRPTPPTTEPTTKQASETTTKQASETTTKQASETTTKQASETTTEATTKSTAEQTTEPTIDSTTAATTKPISESTEKPTKDNEEIANTADNTMIGAFVALSVMSAAGIVALKKKHD